VWQKIVYIYRISFGLYADMRLSEITVVVAQICLKWINVMMRVIVLVNLINHLINKDTIPVSGLFFIKTLAVNCAPNVTPWNGMSTYKKKIHIMQ